MPKNSELLIPSQDDQTRRSHSLPSLTGPAGWYAILRTLVLLLPYLQTRIHPPHLNSCIRHKSMKTLLDLINTETINNAADLAEFLLPDRFFKNFNTGLVATALTPFCCSNYSSRTGFSRSVRFATIALLARTKLSGVIMISSPH
jgi:hypothetical protein